MSLRRSSLHLAHLAAGARFVEFGGWEMPLSYPSGTLAEHLSCRNDAVAFDVSHLGSVALDGDGAYDLLQQSFTNDLRRVTKGKAQYTHILDPDGSVSDDCIIWWVDDDHFEVMPNASNTEGVRATIGGEDVTDFRALVAIQGPNARKRLASLSPEAAAIGHFRVERFSFHGATCLGAGTGYTGEDGVECSIPLEVANDFWQGLMEAGIAPAGLGARDTLRLEAGLPLFGHELGPGITPLQAGLGWVVGWDKGEFRGRQALEREREEGVRRLLRGLVTDGRRLAHEGDACSVPGVGRGEVTSGNFSPVLSRAIALAFLPPSVEDGTQVIIEGHSADIDAIVVKPPFHRLVPSQWQTTTKG